MTHGACYLRGCHKCSACCISVTDGPIALKFGMHLGTQSISYSLCNSHGWGISARAHVQRCPHTALLYLGNGLANRVQIWCASWGSLTKCLPQVIDGVHLHVRTCAPLFHKCSACCFSVTVGPIALKCDTYALGDPLVTAYAVVTGGVSLHVRTCRPRFCISGTAWPIGFIFGV